MNHSGAQAASPTSRLGNSAASSSSSSDLWSEILRSADRGKRGSSYGRKNILLLSERNRGRRYFLDQLTASSSTTAKRRNMKKSSGDKAPQTLAMGYEVLEVKEDGDEDSVPPVSIFYPPSSHRSMLRLLPKSLPPNSLSDTSVVILLDWTKPYSMIRELINWLVWVQSWASSALQPGQADEFRERLQSHIQHYSEPQAPTPGSSTSANPPLASMSTTYDTGPLLPLGQGTLTLNECGIPITIVCTRADLMDATGDELGMKGGGWEERTDWIQQILRTISLAYGAALFYTAPTQPQTYSLVRSYLLHRLYTVPPPLHPQTKAESSTSSYPQAGPSSAKFPFSYRANVLDRDAVMVPTGWDSYGKINVLRDRFDPPRVAKALGVSLERAKRMENEQGDLEGDDEGEGVEDLWREMIPDMESSPQAVNSQHVATTSEPEQTFLSRQLDILVKDPNRDPRASFRTASAALGAASNATTSSSNITALMGSPDAGIVGPMGAGGLSLPGVEKAMMDMEGGSVEDMREKFARLGRRDPTKGGPLSPTGVDASTGRPASSVPNEALHNFFQGLLATKGKSSTPSKSTATSPSAPARTAKEA